MGIISFDCLMITRGLNSAMGGTSAFNQRTIGIIGAASMTEEEWNTLHFGDYGVVGNMDNNELLVDAHLWSGQAHPVTGRHHAHQLAHKVLGGGTYDVIILPGLGNHTKGRAAHPEDAERSRLAPSAGGHLCHFT